MAGTVKLKRSAVEGKAPTTSDLSLGEIAINTFDGKVYTEKDNGTASIVEVGSNCSSYAVDGKHSIESIVETSTGSNLILNNSFQSGDATSWSGGGNATRTFMSNSVIGSAQLPNADVAHQAFTTVIGTTYSVSSTMGGNCVTKVYNGSGVGGTLLKTLTSVTASPPSVAVTDTFTATSTTTTVSLVIIPSGGTAQFKDIVVAEQISDDVLELKNTTSSDTYATFTEDGGCTLYHDNAARLETTANGLNLTGLPVYADNAAATTGGLEEGDVYRTSAGELRIKY